MPASLVALVCSGTESASPRPVMFGAIANDLYTHARWSEGVVVRN